MTSTDNATVKHFAKLVKSKAHRDANGSVVVAGAGLLEEIYANGGVEDARVVFLGEAAETPRGMRARRVVRAPEHVLKKAAGLQSVDRVDVVAELATPPEVLCRGVSRCNGKVTENRYKLSLSPSPP